VKVAAIILAAGASTRLGEPKQLVTLGGERLLERAIHAAQQAGCDPVVVVLGAHADRIVVQCRLDRTRTVVNPDWREGMASSIRCGLAQLDHQPDAAILMTCDQPAVTAEHLRALMQAGVDAPVASHYEGRRGVPACFPAASFVDLSLLAGDEGARRLLQSALTIELVGGELDIDSPQTLAVAKSIYG